MKPLVAETSLIINASVEQVWEVMTNTKRYPKWNPFVIRVEKDGDVTKRGTKMNFLVQWNNGKHDTSAEVVTGAKKPHPNDAGVMHAVWCYRFNGWLSSLSLVQAIRYQWLTEQPDGTTLYRTREEFTGFLKHFIPLAEVQDGFERQAKAMAAYLQAPA